MESSVIDALMCSLRLLLVGLLSIVLLAMLRLSFALIASLPAAFWGIGAVADPLLMLTWNSSSLAHSFYNWVPSQDQVQC